jgi:hypothetical protein
MDAMPVWHWVFIAASGGLAGWSLVAYRRGGERAKRGHLLRTLVAIVACLAFVYDGWVIAHPTAVATLALGLVMGGLGYLFGLRRSFRQPPDED